MENTTADIGVIVGRFQVDKLHEAHKALIESVLTQHKKVVIFLGVTPALITRNNPLDFVTRKEMILQDFPRIIVIPIPDTPSDHDWSLELDKRLRECCPVGSVMLYGGRDSFIKYYSGQFPTTELEPKSDKSGTQVRMEVSREVKASPDFRAGVIYAAYNQYKKVYPTVDVAIMNEDKLLLGRKPHQTLFRFVGGFVDPTDDSYEMAAKREVSEETGLEIGDVTYIGSCKVEDWRYRNEEDKIITHLFTAKYLYGKPQANDDIVELKWFSVDNISENEIVEEHRPLFKMLMNKLGKQTEQ